MLLRASGLCKHHFWNVHRRGLGSKKVTQNGVSAVKRSRLKEKWPVPDRAKMGRRDVT